MSPPKPSRRAAVAPFMAMDVLRQARRLEQAGRQIIHMELGEPGAPAPLLVREAAAAALRDGRLGYGEAMGDAVLRERIARHYAEHYGVEVAPDRVMMTTGSSGAFLLAFLAGFDAGARIGVVQPGYPAYANILEALGLSLTPLEVGPETRFAPTVELIEAAHRRERLDGLLLMSPANPTGAMIAPAELEKICAFCEDAGVVLVSDEIYHRLEYEGRAETALRFSRGAIVVNSFSKYYAMTGWRLGWAIAPASLARPMERLQQSLAICAPTLSQRAALAAFDAGEELESIKRGYARSRSLLLRQLPRIGLPRFAPPDGAFYIYADVSHLTTDSTRFCTDMLEEIGVAATPGVDFDRARGGSTLRISYAGPPEDVALGVERLSAWLSRST
ncbi:MAG TPA: aminotransferase class I/II-fold pyridoxal phosphate-dependent enzyme [Methylocystis sp.]|jgi:aspartate/methionine/tyrosine aminotransferase